MVLRSQYPQSIVITLLCKCRSEENKVGDLVKVLKGIMYAPLIGVVVGLAYLELLTIYRYVRWVITDSRDRESKASQKRAKFNAKNNSSELSAQPGGPRPQPCSDRSVDEPSRLSHRR